MVLVTPHPTHLWPALPLAKLSGCCATCPPTCADACGPEQVQWQLHHDAANPCVEAANGVGVRGLLRREGREGAGHAVLPGAVALKLL